MRCILTLADFNPEDHGVDGEHILPAVLGGNLKTKRVISPAANQQTGHLEAALKTVFDATLAQFRIAHERDRRHVKTFHFTDDNGKHLTWNPAEFTLTLAHDLIGEPIEQDDGSYTVHSQIPVSNNPERDAERAQQAAVKRISRRTGKEVKLENATFEIQRAAAPTIEIEHKFTDDALRGTVKTAFVFAAHCLGADAFTGSAYDHLRNIILGNGNPYDVLWQSPHGSAHWFAEVTAPHHALGTFAHEGQLFACVAYFMGFVFLVHLGPSPAPNGTVNVAVLDPTRHTHRDAPGLDLGAQVTHHSPDGAWAQPRASEADVAARLKSMLDTWASQYRTPSIEFLVERASRQIAWPGEGEEIDHSLIEAFHEAVQREIFAFYQPVSRELAD